MDTRFTTIPIAVLSLGLSAATLAEEIYHWVDENGVQHFSQTAPASATAPVETVTLPESPAPAGGEQEDLYNVAATAARTQALREELDQRREERLEREQSEAARPVQQIVEPVRYAAPWLWDRPGNPRPPARPPQRPEPPPRPTPPSTWKPPGGDSN